MEDDLGERMLSIIGVCLSLRMAEVVSARGAGLRRFDWKLGDDELAKVRGYLT